ncbi:MAG: peptidoglycan DD-metalloendopeptidase family protein [bacterium]
MRNGDTLTSLLGDYLPPEDIHRIARRSDDVFPVRQIRPGQTYQIRSADGRLESFIYRIDQEDQLLVRRLGDRFQVSREPIPHTVRTVLVSGSVQGSPIRKIGASGQDPKLVSALVEILAWDVDFLRNLKAGDTFRVLLEQRFRDGKPAGYGRVLAAEFRDGDRAYRAVLFQDGDDPPRYYTPQGLSVRKAFLEAPLVFSRVSSGYSKRRLHPITRTWMPHPGIDYAAPVGTPVKAVGGGTVLEAARNAHNGKYVRLRHRGGFETSYLHLSRFARKIKKGTVVAQGQVIGYVGRSGMATGPHLCFRMTRHGVPMNPRKLHIPSGPPVSADNMEAFTEHAERLLAALDGSGSPGPDRIVSMASGSFEQHRKGGVGAARDDGRGELRPG